VDLRRPLTGPAYARRLAGAAAAAGAEIRVEAMATGWADPQERALEVTSPHGREVLRPRAVVLATGCRERPRPARLVPGTRPAGVLTTGLLQQLVELQRTTVGERALVVGAEHVSFSALETLRRGGARAVGMVTERERHQSLAVFRAGAALVHRAPLWTRTAVTAIHGRRRVEAVELTDLRSGARREVACDTVVFTADWIPDHELAVLGGATLAPATRGPAVTAGGHTTLPGVFAAGNVLHPAETAGVCALGGRHVAAGVLTHLRGASWPAERVPLRAVAPLLWVAPQALAAGAPAAPPRGRLLLRSDVFARLPRLRVSQGARTLWTGRVPQLVPGRSAHVPATWLGAVDPAGGAVTVALA
jgi:thioredoxin reductase